ncbi:MAG TPA: methyltransferase domain-containing protein [Micromonosporaceae bacterium]
MTEQPERDFWAEAWRTGRTAFHRERPHPDLVAYHDATLGDARRVLVPLCGRTPDLAFLAERHDEVVGVEFVPEAVELYAEQHGLVASGRVGSLTAYRRGGLTVLLGDFFAVPDALGPFDAIWDRAALVALDAATRPRYAETCRRLLRNGGTVLLATFVFDRPDDVGPPYSVRDDEITRLYPGATIKPLTTTGSNATNRMHVIHA